MATTAGGIPGAGDRRAARAVPAGDLAAVGPGERPATGAGLPEYAPPNLVKYLEAAKDRPDSAVAAGHADTDIVAGV